MIYMDNAASTRPYEEALNTFTEASRVYYFNTASIHPSGRKAGQLLEASRRQVLELMGLGDYECIFTSGATESNNIAIQGILETKKQFGSTVLLSELEHPSVVNVAEEMKNKGFNVKYIKTTGEGVVDVDSLKKLLDNDVIFVTVMAVNNITGSIQPVPEIVEILKSYPKAYFHVDATQAVGKVMMDYNGVDSLSLSAHKFHGVKGAGALIVKEVKTMSPIAFGGGHEFNIRSGTVNLAAVAAMAKALRMSMESLEDNRLRISRYSKAIREAASALPSVHVQPGGVPHIINVSYAGAQGEVVVNGLSQREIMVSTTSACASKLSSLNETLTAMKNSPDVVKGSIRISMGHFTNDQEADKLVSALNSVHKEIGGVLK